MNKLKRVWVFIPIVIVFSALSVVLGFGGGTGSSGFSCVVNPSIGGIRLNINISYVYVTRTIAGSRCDEINAIRDSAFYVNFNFSITPTRLGSAEILFNATPFPSSFDCDEVSYDTPSQTGLISIVTTRFFGVRCDGPFVYRGIMLVNFVDSIYRQLWQAQVPMEFTR
jgi:hypothetical protein